MATSQVHHASSDRFEADTVAQDYIRHRGGERLPPSLAMPLIAGLSGTLWVIIWHIGRSVTGL